MNSTIFNVTEPIEFDNSIIHAELHTYLPYASTSFKNSDEIRIPLQNQDVYTLPWRSKIYIEGKLTRIKNGQEEPSNTATLINNGLSFLFDEIRYELGGAVIDRARNPGITSTMKNYISYNSNESKRLMNAGWYSGEDTVKNFLDQNGNFSACIPLRMILGMTEDFRKIILNLRQELVFIRSTTDNNAIYSTDSTEVLKLEIFQIKWLIHHISAADVERLHLMKIIEKSLDLKLAFRSWELHEYPKLQETTRHTWNVKTTTQLEKPRFVIFGFQTDRKNKIVSNMSKFDHCNLTNIKLYLNSEMFPYDNLNLNFKNNHWSTLYDMYADFQLSYYERESEPSLTPAEFKNIAPLFVIDCTHQNETLKTGAVDIRLEFETSENIAANTTAYCLILHDKLVKYNPFSSA